MRKLCAEFFADWMSKTLIWNPSKSSSLTVLPLNKSETHMLRFAPELLLSTSWTLLARFLTRKSAQSLVNSLLEIFYPSNGRDAVTPIQRSGSEQEGQWLRKSSSALSQTWSSKPLLPLTVSINSNMFLSMSTTCSLIPALPPLYHIHILICDSFILLYIQSCSLCCLCEATNS